MKGFPSSMRNIYLFVPVFCLGVLDCAAADGLTGLRDYLKQYKYAVFVPPRQNAALDTVITFIGGFESVVTSKCVPKDKVPNSTPAMVALTDHTGNITTNTGLEGSFARTLDPSINISGAFSDTRVQSISIQISDPNESHIESKDLKDYISSLPAGDSCRAVFLNKNNLVLENLLSISGIKYNFYDKDGKQIKLDAALLQAIHLSPMYKKDYENRDSLELKTPVFVGYRAWKVRQIPGAVKSTLELNQFDPTDLNRSRKAGL